ncbi:iron ABC transporter [Leptolyngbya valderiana BDU 20041]|nr:iron ABC transporter [Leptolyngbya valderiana BDU 20041]
MGGIAVKPHHPSRRFLVWWVLLGLFLLAVSLDLSVGSVSIPLKEIVTILLGGDPEVETWRAIVLTFRLPKAITAIVAGAALSVAGLQMQTLFGNPLAGPFVLGISSGASLGVALVVLVGSAGSWERMLSASGGAAVVLGLVVLTAQRVRNRETLLLLGLMFGYAANAIVTILLHFSSSEQMQSYITWTFGSFGGVTWDRMTPFVVTVCLGLLVAYLLAKPLNLLLLGETSARTLGLRMRWLQFWTITSAAVLAGSVTAFCGPIAFLGVAVPHLSRALLKTSDTRHLLLAVTVLGATLALYSDWVAQLPGRQVVLPLNAVTAALGTPVVTHAILQRHRR